MLMFDVPSPLQSKRLEVYKRAWDLFFSWPHDLVDVDITEMSMTAGSDLAIVTAVMRCAGTAAILGLSRGNVGHDVYTHLTRFSSAILTSPGERLG